MKLKIVGIVTRLFQLTCSLSRGLTSSSSDELSV
jgi:hypothetical protein